MRPRQTKQYCKECGDTAFCGLGKFKGKRRSQFKECWRLGNPRPWQT